MKRILVDALGDVWTITHEGQSRSYGCRPHALSAAIQMAEEMEQSGEHDITVSARRPEGGFEVLRAAPSAEAAPDAPVLAVSVEKTGEGVRA